MDKSFEQALQNEGYTCGNKYVKGAQIDFQIKTTLRYYYLSTRMTNIK